MKDTGCLPAQSEMDEFLSVASVANQNHCNVATPHKILDQKSSTWWSAQDAID